MPNYREAINQIVADDLAGCEQAALARMLTAIHEAGSGRRKDDLISAYARAVNFLWMIGRIVLEQRHQLLDLGV